MSVYTLMRRVALGFVGFGALPQQALKSRRFSADDLGLCLTQPMLANPLSERPV